MCTNLKKNICFFSFLIFLIIYVLLITNKTLIFDNRFYEVIQKIIKTTLKEGSEILHLTEFFKLISDIGSGTGIIIILIVVISMSKTRSLIAYNATLTIFVSVILNTIIKNIVMRPRPNILRLVSETSYSFPSGHSMNNMALYTVFILATIKYVKNEKIKRALVVLFSLIPILIAFSRVYLGVHYLSDVFAGLALGVSVALFISIRKDLKYPFFKNIMQSVTKNIFSK